jgi:hypothetical protein
MRPIEEILEGIYEEIKRHNDLSEKILKELEARPYQSQPYPVPQPYEPFEPAPWKPSPYKPWEPIPDYPPWRPYEPKWYETQIWSQTDTTDKIRVYN